MGYAEDFNNAQDSEDEASDNGSAETDGSPEQMLPNGMPGSSEAVHADGRRRRRAVFDQQTLEGHSSESEEDDEDAAMPRAARLGGGAGAAENGDDAGDASDDSEGRIPLALVRRCHKL